MLSSSSGRAFLVPAADLARSPQAPLLPAAAVRTATSGADETQWAAFGALATAAVAGATVVRASRRGQLTRRSRHSVAALADEESAPAVGRRELLRGAGAAGVSTLLPAAAPLPAAAKSLQEAQQTLVSLGLGDMAPTENQPGGWKYVVETYGLAGDANFGKFKMGNEAKAVTFTVPNLWVISRPTIDFNGSAGTIAANDFGKGDSATLFVDVAFKGKLADLKKPDFRDEMLKALTLKGKGFIEDFKVGKVRDGAPGYRIIEYSYEIESEAGFSINRDGVASFAQAGDDGSLQIFWTGIVTPRYNKEMVKTLNTIAESFRIGKISKTVTTRLQGELTDFQRKDEADAIANGSAVPFNQMQY